MTSILYTQFNQPPSRLLSAKAKEDGSTIRHHAEVVQLQNNISQSLSELHRYQCVLMPGPGPILDAMGDEETAEAPSELLLPSELSLLD